MEDVGKALIMAAQVLMFVVASTVSIYLYSTLTNNVDEIMLANNYSNRGDAIVDIESADNARIAKKEEVIMAILDLKDKYEKTGSTFYNVIVKNIGGSSITYKYVPDSDKISCDGTKYDFNSSNLRTYLVNNIKTSYKISYTNYSDSKSIIYKEN